MKLKPYFVAFLALLIATGCTTAPKSHSATQPASKPAEPQLTDAQKKKNVESFDEVWTTIRDKHFDPKLNGADWNGARDELRPKVENAKTMSEARAAMEELLARLHQTHFGIIPGNVYRLTETDHKDEDSSASDEGRGGTTGIEIRVVDDHALVVAVQPGSGGEAAGVKAGWELISVRDKPMAPVIAELAKAVKSESLRPAMQAITLTAALGGKVGKTVPATFIDGANKTVEKKIAVKKPTGKLVKMMNLPEMAVSFDCRKVDPNISVFRLNIFLDPPDVMSSFRGCVEKAAADHATGFIIDLRGNHGGLGIMSVGMGNLFVSKPDQYLGQMFSRQGPGMKFELDPQPTHYDGPLAILVDECSISTSEIMAGGLRDIGRARIFGTRTAGAALPSQIVVLPNEDRFQYAVANYISAGGKELEGTGVMPDQVVVPDRASLLAGEDPILDAAVAWCKSQKMAGKH